MDLNLDGKVAIITGGSKGIGLATASALADEGVLVVVGARTETEELRRLRENRDVHYVGTDLATAPGVERLVSAAAKVRDGVDILVNNVARSEPAERAVDFTDEQWRRIDLMRRSSALSGRSGHPFRTCSNAPAPRSSTSARSTRNWPPARSLLTARPRPR
jgi:NAD(P)-dependent dehydrogenase (short-subunit alcohol dehydrogenase family)